jgi:hypothetical protein
MKLRYYLIVLWWCLFNKKKADHFYWRSKSGMNDLYAYKEAKLIKTKL